MNALGPIFVNPVPSAATCRELQPLNALDLISLTVSGTFTLFISVQLMNASPPMHATSTPPSFSGIITVPEIGVPSTRTAAGWPYALKIVALPSWPGSLSE